MLDEIKKDYKKAFGDDLKMWHEYGWWLQKITSLIEELYMEEKRATVANPKEVLEMGRENIVTVEHEKYYNKAIKELRNKLNKILGKEG